MDPQVLELVASIESGNFELAIASILDAKPEQRSTILAETVDMMNIRHYETVRQLEEANRQLAMREQLEDNFSSAFINNVVMSIGDPPAALRAATLYSTAWFQTLEFSLVVKIQFAQRLIEAVSRFNPSYVPGLWLNVVKGVPGALEAIAFTTEPRTIEEE
jgi:hypothetical protein